MTLALIPFRKVFAALSTSAVLAACTSPPAKPPGGAHATLHVEGHDIEPFVRHGYLVQSRQPVITHREQLSTSTDTVDLLLLRPEHGAPQPLVVYLPGLGETIDAGESLRQTWAEAGYAVLSLQATSDGPSVWASSAARDGDFAGIARLNLAPARVRSRATALHEVLAKLSDPGARADSPYARINFDRIALAGFELGAAGALIAGEHTSETGAPPQDSARIVAIIAIAPFPADTTELDLADATRPPVLYITGRASDRYRLGGHSPQPQTAEVRRMLGRDAALSLPSADLAVLSGTLPSRPQPEAGRRRTPAGKPDTNPASGDFVRPETGGRAARGMGRSPDGPDPRLDGERERARIAIRSVTLAFLDARVLHDPAADYWLTQRAGDWLGALGEFR